MRRPHSRDTGAAVAASDGFRIRSLKMRIIVVVTLLLAALTAALTYASFISYQADARNRSASMLQETVEQISVNIARYFQEINHVSLQVYYNNTIMNILNSPPTDDEVVKLESRRIVEDELKRMLLLGRNDVLSCYIIGTDVYRVARQVGYLDIDREYEASQWYRDAVNGLSFSLLIEDTNPSRMVCSIVRRIRGSGARRNAISVMKINFNSSGISEICDRVQSGYGGRLCVLNEKGALVYGGLPDDFADVSALADGISYRYGEQEYLANQSSVSGVGWRVLLLHPLRQLEMGAYRTMRQMLLLSSFILLIVGAAVFILTRSSLAPLANITRSMRIIRQGDQHERMPVGRSDEIGYLAVSVNEMLDRIKATQDENTQLMKRVYESELLRRDIQMRLLTKQIHPHFIFNILNMIAIEAEMGDIDRCTENIRRLSTLLRAFTYGDSMGTLDRELELIRNYLLLYRDRYSDRLSFDIEVPDSYLLLPFPLLLLQPLVENAIHHGCEETSRQTHIRICATQDGRELRITVSDNAGGVAPQKLDELRAMLGGGNASAGSGIGLMNVNQRIKLMYGEAYGLTIDSGAGETRVTVRMPLPDAGGASLV